LLRGLLGEPAAALELAQHPPHLGSPVSYGSYAYPIAGILICQYGNLIVASARTIQERPLDSFAFADRRLSRQSSFHAGFPLISSH
jgi:hypothetical protein